MQDDPLNLRAETGIEVRAFADRFGLSRRETELMDILVNRSTGSDAIARHMGVSQNTVRNHFQNLFHKTGTRSKTDLMAGFIRSIFHAPVTTRDRRERPTLTVLHVVDTEHHRRLLKRAMSKAKFRGEMYQVGSVAFRDYLEKLPDDPGTLPRPDLILLNLNGASERHGPLIAMLRRQTLLSSTPVTALTSGEGPAAAGRIYAAGVNSVLECPEHFMDWLELVQLLEKYWGEMGGPYRAGRDNPRNSPS